MDVTLAPFLRFALHKCYVVIIWLGMTSIDLLDYLSIWSNIFKMRNIIQANREQHNAIYDSIAQCIICANMIRSV